MVHSGTVPCSLSLVYYWLTPAFWLADEFLGANFRTAALEGHSFWKAAYYEMP